MAAQLAMATATAMVYAAPEVFEKAVHEDSGSQHAVAPLFRYPMIRDEQLAAMVRVSTAVPNATRDLIDWHLNPGCCSSYGDCSTGTAAVTETTLASVATTE